MMVSTNCDPRAYPRAKATLLLTLCLLGAALLAPAASAAVTSGTDFSLISGRTTSHEGWPHQHLFLGAWIDVVGTSLVPHTENVDIDYTDAVNHWVGTGSYSVSGSYDPGAKTIDVHLQFSLRTIIWPVGGDGHKAQREVLEYDGHFTGVVGQPGGAVTLTSDDCLLKSWHWDRWLPYWDGAPWYEGDELYEDTQPCWAPTLAFTMSSQRGPQAVANVQTTGSFWISHDGGTTWTPLSDGPLRPGDIISYNEPDYKSILPDRAVVTFTNGYRCTLEPGSRMRVYDWGCNIESGGAEVRDNAGNGRTGWQGGSEEYDAFTPPARQGAGLVALRQAAGGYASRIEVTPSGTKVSVYTGRVKVTNTITNTSVSVRGGQSVTVTEQGISDVDERTFTDVQGAHPYREAIIGMALKGVIEGYKVAGGYEFRPGEPVKRAQFAKMISGTMGIRATEDLAVPFSDLGDDDPAKLYPHEYVAAAAAVGITTGTGQGRFAPYEPIKRAQVVTMVVRAADQLWPGALDTPPADYRGQLASFTDATHGQTMRTAEYNGLLEGLSGFGVGWDPWAQASRGEVAQILWNLMAR